MNINPNEAKAELCRRTLFKFVKEFWYIVSPEDPVWNWHIEYLCNTLQEDLMRVCKIVHTDPVTKKETILKDREPKLHDGIANVPPGSSKSTIYTIMAPAWLWTVDPTIKILTASYSADLAIDHAVKSRDVIQSDKYRLYFPTVEIRADHNNKANYKNTRLGERYATSVGGSITGFHAHVIIIDDPINTKQAASEAELETAISFMDSTLPTRKINKEVSFTQIVMQRLHELDPTGHWLKKKGKQIRHVCLPAILSELVSPPELSAFYVEGLMDAKRMPRKVLEEMLIELGSYNFAGQMGQAPAPEGGGVWQKWIIPIPDRDFPNPSELEKYGTDWDTAYTDKKTNASSAYVTSGKKGNKMFIDKFGYFQKEFPELIKAMRLQAAPHYIEAKACFSAGTMVRTAWGLKAIQNVDYGEMILTINEQTGKTEMKKVLKRLVFDSFQHLCIFKLRNGETIKCTTNHEIYFEGAWHFAGDIARRIMDADPRALLHLNRRTYFNSELEGGQKHSADETRSGRVRILTNSAENRWTGQDAEDSPLGGAGVLTQSGEQSGGQSQKLYSKRQSVGEFGVGNEIREPETFRIGRSERRLQKRGSAQELGKGVSQRIGYIERAKSKRDKRKIQAEGLHQKDAGCGVRSKHTHDNRLYTSWLEARQIKSVSFTEGLVRVYDLHVEYNHNYCITSGNIVVHNSGKSAKQTLTTAGIPAIEVQVNADKLARARDATPKAEAGMVYCRASLLDKLYNDDQQGILKFPNGPKADVADTLSQAIQRHFGTVTRTGSFGWDEEHDFMPKRFPNRSMIIEPVNEQLVKELKELDKPKPQYAYVYDDGADLI